MDTILQAIKLVEQNKIEQALKLLKKYVPKATDDEKFTIAELYLKWGFLDEAEEILTELLKRYPEELDLKLSLADIYIEQEKDEWAIALLDEIPETDPRYIQALLQLADLYQVQGLFEVAEQKLLTAKQIVPNEVVIDFALGELYFSIGTFHKAVNHYEKVLKEHKTLADVSIRDRLAESYAAIGKYEEALEYFEVGDDTSPDKYFKYGVTANQAKRNDIAIPAWKRVIELAPYYHAVYENLAEALIEEGRLEEAFETAEEGLKNDSFNKQLYFIGATIAHQLNKEEKSEEYVREAIALDPDYLDAILFLVEFLKDRNRHSEIIEMLSEVKASGTEEPLYDWELARAFEEEERYKEALQAYKNAHIHLYEDTDFLKEYGYFLTEEGLIQEAITVFQEYLSIIPQDFTIQEYVDRIQNHDD